MSFVVLNLAIGVVVSGISELSNAKVRFRA
nr:hypothetical protein [Campylobacter sp. 19-13652]